MSTLVKNGKIGEYIELQKPQKSAWRSFGFIVVFSLICGSFFLSYTWVLSPKKFNQQLNNIRVLVKAGMETSSLALSQLRPNGVDDLKIEFNSLFIDVDPIAQLLEEDHWAQRPKPVRELASQKVNLKKILDDPYHRISPEFDVSPSLRNRTQFWFDIYTKHDSTKHVIHHTRYPWIVFQVVDTSDIIKSNKGHFWSRYHRAKRVVVKEKRRIRKALRRLAKKKSFKHLKGLELSLYQKLKPLRGKRRNVARFASKNVRAQLGQKDFFLKGLRSSRKYLAYMEAEFENAGLPVELTRLPFVESSFNVRAQSRVGASGIWQIMPRTGRSFLKVGKYIDERNSPLKATRAAAQLLRSYHRSFKSWPLTVTAYNHGIGGLLKAIRRARSNQLPKIISRYHKGSFKFASSNFYTSFLAALYAEKYHAELFDPNRIEKDPLIIQEAIRLTQKIKIKKLIRLANIEPDTLLDFNLDLRKAIKRNIYLPSGHVVFLPERAAGLLKKKKLVIPVEKNPFNKQVSGRTLKKGSG